MVNIRDIAAKSNVSPGTVSRVLNNDPTLSINEKTRERIHQTCRELNYVPRKYRGRNKGNCVGIISAISRKIESDDSYYRQIREKIAQALKAQEYCVDFMIFLPYLEDNWERVKQVDCVVVIGFIKHSIHEKIHQLNPNLIIVDDYNCSDKFSSVSMNLYQETISMLDYAAQLGHRNIAFISGINARLGIKNERVMDILGERERAYDEWMTAHHLEKYKQLFIGEGWYAQSGYEEASKLLATANPRPTLIISASDVLALGIVRKLTEENISLPDELSICSFDDLEVTSYLTPSLTTLRIDIDQMVHWVIELCKEVISEKNFMPTRIVLSGKLILRESLQAIEEVDIQKN
ncbi:LacI family transcriptional regulator [Pilibacter termitis]|uniref:LacI family transcriptional regulator n=1 Tax=Pilibacter termitis TaxID=263852 RepID=A0A1T4Q2I7_9ENTE|nr:LacI family DNA-binding transcriptional regulator [Pilibacter termitis]SJZ97983.1 LacI family transcriptional regulator [Pilibacter termitis]